MGQTIGIWGLNLAYEAQLTSILQHGFLIKLYAFRTCNMFIWLTSQDYIKTCVKKLNVNVSYLWHASLSFFPHVHHFTKQSPSNLCFQVIQAAKWLNLTCSASSFSKKENSNFAYSIYWRHNSDLWITYPCKEESSGF